LDGLEVDHWHIPQKGGEASGKHVSELSKETRGEPSNYSEAGRYIVEILKGLHPGEMLGKYFLLRGRALFSAFIDGTQCRGARHECHPAFSGVATGVLPGQRKKRSKTFHREGRVIYYGQYQIPNPLKC
jgi:hypothetical protein